MQQNATTPGVSWNAFARLKYRLVIPEGAAPATGGSFDECFGGTARCRSGELRICSNAVSGMVRGLTGAWSVTSRIRPSVDDRGSRTVSLSIATRAVDDMRGTMDVEKKILICGAGIAGPACAFWLRKYGYSVVLVERAKSFRDGGQNVDVKGAGQQVIKMMGLDKEIEARDTLEQGQRYLDEAGNLIATFPKGSVGTLTSDFEILRGDFAHVLFDATKAATDYRFGTFVTRLDDSDAGISATFNDGTTEHFELVICAEGVSSATRAMVLPDETHFRYLGAYMSFFKIPRRPEDDNWAVSVNGAGGTFITLRPGNDRETTVLMTFLRKDHRIEEDGPPVRRLLLIDALKGRGTVAERILAELDTVEDFYFGPMSQVRASTWSKGRFVMIGDAAHCPTPFTGSGTALALVGAYVLAGEISKSDCFAAAFGAYEKRLRPYVEATQNQLSPRFVRLLHVKTRLGITLTHLAQRFFASSRVQKLLRPSDAKRQQAVVNDFDLPNYS